MNKDHFKKVLRKERISALMLAEWCDIPYPKVCAVLFRRLKFTIDEERRIFKVFENKYSEIELFGEEIKHG